MKCETHKVIALIKVKSSQPTKGEMKCELKQIQQNEISK